MNRLRRLAAPGNQSSRNPLVARRFLPNVRTQHRVTSAGRRFGGLHRVEHACVRLIHGRFGLAHALEDDTVTQCAVPSTRLANQVMVGIGDETVGMKLPLSELDARIIESIAAGERTVHIANKVYLSRQGVEYHVSKLLQRLRVPNRPALIAKVYSMGILSVGTWPPEVCRERLD
ncbi:helix-turn-helix transcriptional regulator [Micromonospora carbonacea]|uniref:helix-turn-helix transcriptional regulator n=2 Tax=Micromonospora carbonacea TaxID=47853 RepID=UPI00371D40A0